MGDLNRTKRGKAAAEIVSDHNFQSHRGAMRMKPWDAKKTWCVVLYGNDCYQGDDEPDRAARTKAYVHRLYAGFANVLPEGAVEFGTTDDGYSWAIVLHLPKHNQIKGRCRAIADFLHVVVWNAWGSELPFRL